jgi:FMN phosphatase YigB (HAD superfamily)
VGSEEAIEVISRFIKSNGMAPYFSEIVTNLGRKKEDGDLDLSYRGTKKVDGTLYKKLARDLLEMGIQPSQALMIGDRPVEDVDKAKENGFKAIQYVGIMKRRISNMADYIVSDLMELKNIVQ